MEFDVGLFVLLMTFVVGLGVIARRLTIPYPILFVIGGLLISFIPRLPSFSIDPDLVFFLFLPPLLYIQAFFTSWRDFRRQLRAILLLAIGLVIATTLAVAQVAHAVIPDFPLAAGLVLGAIISPPDAVAASAIAQNLALPRRLVTLLEGESLINDATGLVAFKISLAAIGTTVVTRSAIWQPGMFLYIAVGGIVTGLIVGWGITYIRRLLLDAGAQIVLTISLLTPFVSYLVADVLDVSGVLSVVATGLFIGWQSPFVLTPSIRLEANAFWNMITYLLNGIIFILIGLQLPTIIGGIRGESWPQLLLYALIVNATCIGVRLFWVFPGAYLPRLLFPHIRRTEPWPDWRQVFILGWSGMRGVVSLAAALTLVASPSFPQAHLVQFLAFSVILTTLVFQGLTLPPLIRYLGVGDDGSAREEENEARQRMHLAVRRKLKEIRGEEKFTEDVVATVEETYRERALALQDALAEQLGWSDRRHHLLELRKLRRAMVAAQRHVLVEMRAHAEIGDDVMHKIERELDLEETRLKIVGRPS